ncbi:hypothetical protein GCM10011491_45930 [Brucella endophytica]|uniref:Uncharacterized protein n=1 Tax=Brucella endophytica TaxID=1963359 RepID=A0A916WLE4_9HYPH|nr:hypothetical protein [Brucella endophytica]GGB12983.1 hypothetical protein GCM10011491_45930 [Brucella endophytica]
MKEQETASGTITVGPAASTKLYSNQLLMVTATVEMTGDKAIPDQAEIVLSVPTGGTIEGNNPQPVVITDAGQPGRTRGVATFFVRITGPNAVKCNADPVQSTWDGLQINSGSQTWNTILDHTVRLSVSNLAKPFIPLAPDDKQLPSATEYTLIACATVTDSTNGDAPVPSYVVQWQSQTGIDLFMTNMNTYLNATDTQKLTPESSAVRGGPNDGGYKVYSASDDQGIARLYLVSTTQWTSGGLKVVPSGASEYVYPGGRFLVSNPNLQTAKTPANPQTQGADAVINLDEVVGPRMGVLIPDYQDAQEGDLIVTLMNGISEDHFLWSSSSTGGAYNSSYAKIDTINDGVNDNMLQYIVGTTAGDVFNSQIQMFPATGKKTVAVPNGVLNPPDMKDGVQIGWARAQNPILVYVPLPYDKDTPAKEHDQIKVYANIDAFYNGTSDERTPVAVGANPDLQKEDITAGYTIVAVDNTPFLHLGDERVSPYKRGQAIFYYQVIQPGLAQGIKSTSMPLTAHVDAVPR